MTDCGDPSRITPRAWTGALLFALLVGGGGALAVAALHARAATEPAPPRPALPVRVAPLALQDGYETVERFIGRVEPARATRVAFERGGLVSEVVVEEGDHVEAGEILARLDAEALRIEGRRLEAARAALEADLALAEATLSRAETLRDRGFETGQALDDARFRTQRLRAAIEETDAALARVALDIEKSTLRAPFAGVLARRDADEGAVLQAGASVGLLQETGRPQARIGLPPARSRRLDKTRAHRIATQAGVAEARLVSVSPDVDPATRTVAALFALPANVRVAMGDVVRLELSRTIAVSGAWVPLSALQEGERGLWTLYAVEDGKEGPVARRAAVEALHVADGRAYVRGPLPDGARIVVDGLNRIAQGQRVDPRE